MKMTMHIDEALLTEVMQATGAASKTAAVHEALLRMAQKYRQRQQWRRGLEMTEDEIREGFDADAAEGRRSDVALMAEEPTPYGA